MSIRDSIDAADDLAFVDVVVPEWGGVKVRLTEPSVDDAVEIERVGSVWRKAHTGQDLPTLVLASIMLATTMRDPATGERVYAPDDWKILSRKNPAVAQRLFITISRLSAKEADLAGESSAVPSGVPSST